MPFSHLKSLAFFGGPKSVGEALSFGWPPITEDLRVAVGSILDDGRLSINDGSGIIGDFEASFSRYCGAAHALSFCNGSSSLHAALFAVGVRPGDEVIVPTLTWPATANAVMMCGAIPVLCDVDVGTMCLSPGLVANKITERTRAVVFVHLWGNPAGVVECASLCKHAGIPLVEDVSHAHGAHIDQKKAGTFGAVGCFSMQASKLLAAGEAGVAITDSEELYKAMLMMGHFGGRTELSGLGTPFEVYAYTGMGPKYRPHPLAIAIAASSLRSLDGWIAARTARMSELVDAISTAPGFKLPTSPVNSSRGAYYGFRILNYSCASTQSLVRLLAAEGVSARREPYRLLHRQPLYHGRRTFEATTGTRWPFCHNWNAAYEDHQFPNAVVIADRAIAIDIPTLSEPSTVADIAAGISKVFNAIASGPGDFPEHLILGLPYSDQE